jgi:hypothetical protein
MMGLLMEGLLAYDKNEIRVNDDIDISCVVFEKRLVSI